MARATWAVQTQDENGRWHDMAVTNTCSSSWSVYKRTVAPKRWLRNGRVILPMPPQTETPDRPALPYKED